MVSSMFPVLLGTHSLGDPLPVSEFWFSSDWQVSDKLRRNGGHGSSLVVSHTFLSSTASVCVEIVYFKSLPVCK